MWSLLQDGGPEVTRGTNKVHYPDRPKYTQKEIFSNLKASMAKMEELENNAPNPKKFITIENIDRNSKCDVNFTGVMDLNKLKEKAK